MKEKHYIFGKIIPAMILFIFMSSINYGQEVPVSSEPGAVQVLTGQGGNLNSENSQGVTKVGVSGQSVQETTSQAVDASVDTEKSGARVKQVKASRPALTTAKGARPPSIVRPSGSGIPKGVGKPGGVTSPGRR